MSLTWEDGLDRLLVEIGFNDHDVRVCSKPRWCQPGWVHTVAQALTLVVSKCTELSRPRDVCSLLTTSRTIRAALQQCRGHVRVEWTWKVDGQPQPSEVLALTGFATWLARHAGLVGAVHLLAYRVLHTEQLQQNILQLGLAAWQAAQATAAAAATQPLPLPLRLEEVSLDFLPRAPVLEGLAAAQLQRLRVLGGELSTHLPTASSQAAFGQLTALRDLHLEGDLKEVLPEGLVAALAQLSQLTKLEAEPMRPEQVQYLPPSLVGLVVKIHSNNISPYVLNLSHLSRLQKLCVRDTDWRSEDSGDLVLPSQLTWLSIGACVQQLSGGTNLQHVTLKEFDEYHAYGVLGALSRLQQPWLLVLHISTAVDAAEIAQDVGAGIGAAHHLTSLVVQGPHRAQSKGGSCVGLCGPLSKLPRLSRLVLSSMPLPRAEVLQLTRLTGLKALGLQNTGGVDDVVAVALVQCMPGLRELSLAGRELLSLGLLPVVATLQSLESLELAGGPSTVVGDFELQWLARLTSLTSLQVRCDGCSHSRMQQFVELMPRLVVVNATVLPRKPAV